MGEGTPHEISIFRFFTHFDFAYFGMQAFSPPFLALTFESNTLIESPVAHLQPYFT